jgi:cation diffusion facilitator CzcD-associated flavoprotein CzcO
VSQPEILAYMKTVCKKYGLYKHIRFRRIVTQLIWVESHHHWKANVLNMNTNSLEEFIFRIV